MYILVLFLPLLSAIISGLFGRRIGTRGTNLLTSSCIAASFVISCCIFYDIILNSAPTYIKLWKWFDLELLIINFELQFDGLTSIMLLVVTGVSSLVHIYSIGYMNGDPHIPRFMSYLSLFTFLMIVLVTSGNYIQLFIGWEGVGLCSYLLINFWYTRIKANKAAIKAMLINRVGDTGLILAMFMLVKQFNTLEFSSINNLLINENLNLICLLLLIGAIGKSAQLGLHTWLPDAMEGPTPVSALIHAATMVTAGVFLIIRSAPLFESSPLALTFVTIIGALTAFFAATVGVVQNDLKKVIAYSTCSQLGYMIMACGISNYAISLFHLMNHAFFKALLFLSAGSVIHAVSDEQDMRKMGGLIKTIPFTYTMILIGSLSLIGFPYLTGFYSKDLLLELIYDKYYIIFAYWLGSISVFLTAFYSIRLIYLTFVTNTNSKKQIWVEVSESTQIWGVVLSLFFLSLGSIFIGYLTKEIIVLNTIPPIISNSVKITPLVFSVCGAISAFVFYNTLAYSWIKSLYFHIIYTFLNSAWQFNFIYNHFIIKNIWKLGHLITYKIIDRGLLEVVGPTGVLNLLIRITQNISNLQSGMIFNYALIMIVFTACFLSGIWYI